MAIEERAKATVELDGQQAKNELAELRERAQAYRKELRDMTEKNDLQGVKDLEKKLKDVNAEMAVARKTVFDYNQVLRNLSGSTIKELERAYGSLSKELKNTTRGTDEYVKKSKQLSQVRAELGKARGDLNQFTTTGSKLTGILTKAVGLVGGFYGAIKLGQTIINSAEATSDKWAVTIGGITSAWDYLKKSFATADFSNFFENIGKAIKAGQEYARQLDEIQDRSRSATTREAEIRLEIAKQTNIYKDVLKTDNERIAAIDKILAYEKELVSVRKDIAKQSWDARMADLDKYGITEKNVIANLKDFEVNRNLIAQADEYNEALKTRQQLSQLYATSTIPLTEKEKVQLQDLNDTINNTSANVVEFAKFRSKYNKLSGEELDELAQMYVNLYTAETAYYENTSRAATKRSQLIKETRGEAAGSAPKIGAEGPMYGVEKFKREDLASAEKELEALAEDTQKILANTYEDISYLGEENLQEMQDMNLEHIKSNAEYELEMAQYTYEGRKNLLKKQLIEGKIAEKEYADDIREIDKELNMARLASLTEMFRLAQEAFGRHTLAYKFAAAAEATIATYLGAAKELDSNDPYWLKLIKIALIIAKGLALVSKINEVGGNSGYFGGGDTGSGSDRQPAGIVHKNEYVVNARQMRDPKIRGIVHNVIEPDRVAHVNFSGAQTAVSNLAGYATGGYVSQPVPVTSVTLNSDQINQYLLQLINETRSLRDDLLSGYIKATYDEREVETITERQGFISKIKASVSR
jgi:hypothetical protein